MPRDAFRTIFDAEIYEFHESMATKTPELYQPLTLFRVQKTAGISATDYIRECRRLKQFRADAERIFEQVDVVITPTVPAPAPKLADLEALAIPDVRPFEMKYLLRNTAPFSSLFWPSMSVPCGFSRDGCRWACRFRRVPERTRRCCGSLMHTSRQRSGTSDDADLARRPEVSHLTVKLSLVQNQQLSRHLPPLFRR